MRELWNVRQVMQFLGLSQSKVYQLKDRIGHIKIDGSVRFHPEDVERFVEGVDKKRHPHRMPKTTKLRNPLAR